MGERIRFWLRVLLTGIKPLDTMARWTTVAVLLLGIAGTTVKLVLHLSWLLTVIILMGILLAVTAEGAYRIWRATDRARLSALTARDDAVRDLGAERQAHGDALVAAQADYKAKLEAERRAALEAAPAVPQQTGLEVVIDDEIQTPFPGTGLILEIEFHVTNHDPVPHSLSRAMTGRSFYFGPPGQLDGEHARMLQAYGVISERRERDRMPSRVLPGETVRGVYVMEFAWDPTGRLPDYTLIIKDGRREYRARPHGVGDDSTGPSERASAVYAR